MVAPHGGTPAKMPFEVITDMLVSIQKNTQRQEEHLTTLAGGLGILQDAITTGPQEDGPCPLGAGRGDAALYGCGALVDPTRRDLHYGLFGSRYGPQ